MKRICNFLPVFLLIVALFTGCATNTASLEEPAELSGLVWKEQVPLSYAEQFTIDRYEGGYSLIRVADGNQYLIVPQGKEAPDGLAPSVTVLPKGVDHIYLAATAVMSNFVELGCGDAIRFSGTKASDWQIDYPRKAMKDGSLLYAGKYREPDYELLLTEQCRLSIQSTMILHSPDVKEKLIELGIPVLVDYSSYESHPLGRSEWIKVYGELMGQEALAEQLFEEQAAQLATIESRASTGKTAVFFYVNSSGQVVTRKSGDYITKMIQLAGGEPAIQNLGSSETATSTITMEMEQFYSQAKDADIFIYNSTIDGAITSIDDLLQKSNLLSGCKAVKNGDVWCTRENLFQEPMKLGTVISDFHAIFTDTTAEHAPVFLYRLESGDAS